MTNIKKLTDLAMKAKEEEAREAARNRPLPKGEEYAPSSKGNSYKREFSTSKEAKSTTPKPAPEYVRNTPLQNHEEAEEPIKVKKPGIFKKFHDYDFNINKENAPKLLPFILYLSCWIILYIANHHYGEKNLVEINRINKEMKDLKADYYTSNAELSNKSIQSKVLKMVDTLGLKELRTPPQRLKLVKEDEH